MPPKKGCIQGSMILRVRLRISPSIERSLRTNHPRLWTGFGRRGIFRDLGQDGFGRVGGGEGPVYVGEVDGGGSEPGGWSEVVSASGCSDAFVPASFYKHVWE